LLSSEEGVGPLLSPGGGLEVRVIVLIQDIDAELQQIPIKGVLDDAVGIAVSADCTSTGNVRLFAVRTAQNDMNCTLTLTLSPRGRGKLIGIAAIFVGQGVLGEGFLASEYELIGNEG
jgi:hypothetical protein